jgi:hypothetical protein
MTMTWGEIAADHLLKIAGDSSDDEEDSGGINWPGVLGSLAGVAGAGALGYGLYTGKVQKAINSLIGNKPDQDAAVNPLATAAQGLGRQFKTNLLPAALPAAGTAAASNILRHGGYSGARQVLNDIASAPTAEKASSRAGLFNRGQLAAILRDVPGLDNPKDWTETVTRAREMRRLLGENKLLSPILHPVSRERGPSPLEQMTSASVEPRTGLRSKIRDIVSGAQGAAARKLEDLRALESTPGVGHRFEDILNNPTNVHSPLDKTPSIMKQLVDIVQSDPGKNDSFRNILSRVVSSNAVPERVRHDAQRLLEQAEALRGPIEARGNYLRANPNTGRSNLEMLAQVLRRSHGYGSLGGRFGNWAALGSIPAALGIRALNPTQNLSSQAASAGQ